LLATDVTEIVGSGKVDMGFKAMIHTLAAKARGVPVTSIGSLLDEPFTGVVYLKDSGITTDFRSLKGKKIGYVGEFGKVCGWIPSIEARRIANSRKDPD
jgi:pyrimidine precursor biosynthesis enzyme